MALPALNYLVSYPDPLQLEVPTGDLEAKAPEENASGTVEDRKILEPVEDEKVVENYDQNHQLPSIVALGKIERPLPPGTIKPSWLETSYQQALARVRERIVGERKLPRNAAEWRYHKAPAPARPDLTRTFPALIQNEVNHKKNGNRRTRHQRSKTYPRATTNEIDDKSKVMFLPPLPVHTLYQNLSASFPSTLSKKFRSVHQNDIYRHTYFPFVGIASLHPKAFSETEIRERSYVLPALCAGCRGDVGVTDIRGLEVLEKDEGVGSEVEGQGILRRDDEVNDLEKDIAVVTQQLQNVCYGCPLSSTPHYHHRKTKRIGGGFAFVRKEPARYDFVLKEDAVARETRRRDSLLLYSSETLFPNDDLVDLGMSVEKLAEPEGPVYEMTVPRQKPTNVPKWILDIIMHHHGNGNNKVKHYQNRCYACLQILRQLLPDYNYKDFSDRSSSGIGTSVVSEAARLDEEARLEEEARLRIEARDTEKQRLEEKRDEYERERRKHLYKAPKAFQPKKSGTKTTAARDPFSKDRTLDVPKNEAFKVRQSTKPTTKIIETKRDERNWKEPEKFKLKKPAPKTTPAEWKAPERNERLRPSTPPLLAPPSVAKKPTVPIQPMKHEPPEPIRSLKEPVEPPPKKKIEKTKFAKPPGRKVEGEPLPPLPPPPEPVRVKIPPPKKKPVAATNTPSPNQEPIQEPPTVIEKIKPVIKEKPRPVPKEEQIPSSLPAKKIVKTEKVDRKPPVEKTKEKKQQEKAAAKKKQPPKEPTVKVKKEVKKEPTPVKQANTPPPPKDLEPPASPPKRTSPEPSPEPTPPRPKDLTPPIPPTPTPPPKESPTQPTPPPREPTPFKAIPPLPPRELTPPPSEREPEPPQVPTPATSPRLPPLKESEKPAPIIKPSKKTRIIKLPKPAPAKKPLTVRVNKIPDKPQKKPKPLVVPIIENLLETVEPPPFPNTPNPIKPVIEVPPLPPIPVPDPPKEPTPDIPEKPTPTPDEPTLASDEPPPPTPPEILEPIVWKRRRVKYKPKKRKWRRVEATPTEAGSPGPVSVDALDYLAKYCIVHKQRIPHYQHVFHDALRKNCAQVNETAPPGVPTAASLKDLDSTVPNAPEGAKWDQDNTSITTETSNDTSVANDNLIRDGFRSAAFGASLSINEEDYVSPMNLADSGKEGGDEVGSGGDNNVNQSLTNFFGTTTFAAEDYLDKLTFQLESLYRKSDALQLKVRFLSGERRQTVAKVAREEFPEILRPGYDPNAAEEESPKGTKTKGEVKFIAVVEELGYPIPHEGSRQEVHPENDDWVLSRLADRHWQMLESESSVQKLDIETERVQEKYDFTQERIAALLDEKARVSIKGSSLKQQEVLSRAATNDDFRRKQSVLYQRMNPVENDEVDVKDVEPILRQVNSFLITEKECQYICHVLDLPQRHRIDFKLFAVVAALSEKVSRLEPFIRKLINKMNFEALEVKMQQAKELFFLLADEDDETDGGEVPIGNLVVELEAGGLNPEHVQLVVDKFNREGKGTVDFLDFLTYIPLFIDIHKNIIADPLNLSRVR